MIPNISCRPELAGVVALALTEPAVRASHRLARFKGVEDLHRAVGGVVIRIA